MSSAPGASRASARERVGRHPPRRRRSRRRRNPRRPRCAAARAAAPRAARGRACRAGSSGSRCHGARPAGSAPARRRGRQPTTVGGSARATGPRAGDRRRAKVERVEGAQDSLEQKERDEPRAEGETVQTARSGARHVDEWYPLRDTETLGRTGAPGEIRGPVSSLVRRSPGTRGDRQPMSPPYRVIQWATGSVGRESLRAILIHPELELAGVLVYSAEKCGRDAGELCGAPHVGIAATDDADAILASDADCVMYAPRHADVDEVCAILRSGKNVAATPFLFHRKVELTTRIRRPGRGRMPGGRELSARDGDPPGFPGNGAASRTLGDVAHDRPRSPRGARRLVLL